MMPLIRRIRTFFAKNSRRSAELGSNTASMSSKVNLTSVRESFDT